MRNLNGYEIGGRTLRVDNACTEKSRMEMQQLLQGPQIENPYGEPVPPEKAPEVISKAVACMPPERLLGLMKELKRLFAEDPTEMEQIFLKNPQLAYAVLQAQVVMEVIDPKDAVKFLTNRNELPNILEPMNVPVDVNPNDTEPPSLLYNPLYILPLQSSDSEFRSMDPRINRNFDPNGRGHYSNHPQHSQSSNSNFSSHSNLHHESSRTRNVDPRGIQHHGRPNDSRGHPRLDNTTSSLSNIRDVSPPTSINYSHGSAQFPPSFQRGSSPPSSIGRRTGQSPPPPHRNILQNMNSGITGSVAPPIQTVLSASTMNSINLSSATDAVGLATTDQEKAALIMQVLQLSDEQINMLPPEQRKSILGLKDQITKSTLNK